MTQRVLVVDDDGRLASMLREYLAAAGFEVSLCEDGTSGLACARREEVDVIVLDVMLPDMDGIEVLKRLRQVSDVPVLMLTARGEDTDRIVGLEIGADDYLPKPFNPRELLARLKAILRRGRGDAGGRDMLRFGRLEIDPASRVAWLDARPCALTGHQFDLLLALATHAGRVLSRDQLLDAVGGDGHDPFDRSVDVHVSRIRAEIEDDAHHPRRIVTVRGAGYLFARHQDKVPERP